MIRSAFIIATVVSLAAAELLAADEAKPNLVIFISDDHSYLDSSIAGASEFPTPNLERLARDGMTFRHAFAPSSSCAPSRAALLTGLMPFRNGSMLNHQPPRDEVTKLPAYLQELGYEVVAFGKVAHYKQGARYGFDHVSHDTFHDERCVRAALEFLEQRASEKPLCLFVGTNWPHVPWPNAAANRRPEDFNPPPTHVDTAATRAWRARYAAAVGRFDLDLGLIYDAAFKRLGQNTLFLHFSDHGAQWPFGKWNLYDAGIHIPFIAVWPDVTRPGSQSEAMLSLVDVLPTLVEVAGGRPPAGLDGQSFAATLTEERAEHRQRIYSTHSGDGRMNAYPIRSVRTLEWKYIRNLEPSGEHSTHIDQGKPVDGSAYWQSWVEEADADPAAAAIVERYRRRPAEELYDLRTDPHEQHNLATDRRFADRLAHLRSELDEWMQAHGDRGLSTERELAAENLRTASPQQPLIPPPLAKYKGREIAQTMHYLGAPWLTRESRDREEDCTTLLQSLNIKPGDVVCDLGCGNGFYSLKLAKLVAPGGKVFAVDIQREMLGLLNDAAAAENIDNIETIHGTVVDPKIPAESVDLVLLVDVYHEFSHPEQMLAGIRRSLKRSGRVALAEFRSEDPKVPIKPLHKMSKQQIMKEFPANGFELVEEFDELPWQHLMFFQRDDASRAAR
jgi:N-sulfoglucosamine sulfohydrolase